MNEQLKGAIKSAMNEAVATCDIATIERAIDGADVVSFDIFDTLVRRALPRPTDVFELVGRRFTAKTGRTLEDFRLRRETAERIARGVSERAEITLDEIYQHVSGVTEHEVEALKEIEVQTELDVCYADSLMSEVYQYALAAEKHLVITSDMYLPRQIEEEILERCGYFGYEHLYLSSETMLTKQRGTVWPVIRDDYPADARILHIGDNPRGDWLTPKEYGICTLLIGPMTERLHYWTKPGSNASLEEKLLWGLLEKKVPQNDDFAEHVGYEVLGPMLLGYSQWLHERAHADGVEHLFFLSREGKILQEAYAATFPDDQIPKSYLYVSRRAVLIPQLAKAQDFLGMVNIVKPLLREDSLGTLAKVIGIDGDEYANMLHAAGLSEQASLGDLTAEQKTKIYEIVETVGREAFAKKQKLLDTYLRQEGVNGKAGIVDIGYSGTMQRALQNAVTGLDATGYYLGVQDMEREEYYCDLKRKGFLFSPGQHEADHTIFRFSCEVFEFLLLNSDGSVAGYEHNGEVVRPILGDKEYDEHAVLLSEAIQKAATAFIRDYRTSPTVDVLTELKRDMAFEAYRRFATHPSTDAIEAFRGIIFLDGSTRELIPTHHGIFYLHHPRAFNAGLQQSAAKVFWLGGAISPTIPWFEALSLGSRIGLKSDYYKKYYRG